MSPSPSRETLHAYWRRNLRLTGVLLFAWFLVSFAATWWARELSFSFFGWPFSFWVAAQGSLVVYVAIVAAYAWCMHRLDLAHGVAEEP